MVHDTLEGRLVTLRVSDLSPPAPRPGRIIRTGRVYDQIGQTCDPNTSTPEGKKWNQTSLLVVTSGGRVYFGRPAIPGVRTSRGVFVDLGRAFAGESNFATSVRDKALGILVVGESVEWELDSRNVITRVTAIRAEDMLFVGPGQESPYPYDSILEDVDANLYLAGIADSVWELGTKALSNS